MIPVGHLKKIAGPLLPIDGWHGIGDSMSPGYALTKVSQRGGATRKECMSVEIPQPIYQQAEAVLNGSTMPELVVRALLTAINQSRRTDMLLKGPPSERSPHGRVRVKITMAPWVAASAKILAHAFSVSVSDVATWAVELEMGRKA
ncbi:MAG: hypothetical protein ACRD3W_30365 [Terriglobales bacterium]